MIVDSAVRKASVLLVLLLMGTQHIHSYCESCAQRRGPNSSVAPPPHDMMWIAGGEFSMGSQAKDAMPDESPVHKVTVSGFWMDIHPVTNRQFREFAKATNYVKAIEGEDEHPVVRISWNDAVAYAEWAGKRLPTETEWEYAAKGGKNDAIYSWGQESFSEENPQANLWYMNKGKNFKGTTPVKSFPANAYALYDMPGNVWNWCSDWYSASYYKENEISENPQGPQTGDQRVKRGGYRISSRNKDNPELSFDDTGFRCLMSDAMRKQKLNRK